MPDALTLRALRKRYPGVVAVDSLDLDVAAGECFGLLGPNGAGKTTTIEICEGLTTPDSGEVLVLGRRWRTEVYPQVRDFIAAHAGPVAAPAKPKPAKAVKASKPARRTPANKPVAKKAAKKNAR